MKNIFLFLIISFNFLNAQDTMSLKKLALEKKKGAYFVTEMKQNIEFMGWPETWVAWVCIPPKKEILELVISSIR